MTTPYHESVERCLDMLDMDEADCGGCRVGLNMVEACDWRGMNDRQG